MHPNSELVLTVEKPAAGGRMLARHEGQVVFVLGAIPGERVRVRVERVSRQLGFATVVEVLESSSDRRTGTIDLACGGSLYAHIAYPRQLALKSEIIADAFARIGRINLPGVVGVAPSPEDGYRMRARLHVRGRLVGFFREGTHDVCDVRQTRQLLPATVDTIDRLMAAIRAAGVDDAAIREIELAENVDASHRVTHLDLAAGADRAIEMDLARLGEIEGLTGLSTAGAAYGDVYVTDTIALDGQPTVALRRHVLAFFQGNRHLINQLVAHVVAQAPSDGEVIDLYAGVGLFAVTAAAFRGARVTAVEGDRVAAADLAANAASSGAVTAVHRSVEDFLRGARPAERSCR